MFESLRLFRLALRAWRGAPLTAVSIAVIVSLGIGGVASFFGPVYSLILSPLGLPDAERLVHVGARVPVFNIYTSTLSEPARFDPIFERIAVFAPTVGKATQWRLPGHHRVLEVSSVSVSQGFFETLGVHPKVGRATFEGVTDSDGVVISERFWRKYFPDGLHPIDTVVDVGGSPRRIIGVMPLEFSFPIEADAWLPVAMSNYTAEGIDTVARLRPNVTISQAATVPLMNVWFWENALMLIALLLPIWAPPQLSSRVSESSHDSSR